jgi:2',3'-cyclic-nucleotide 2'-phosphodiesterase (5'-nucleotidase family)
MMRFQKLIFTWSAGILILSCTTTTKINRVEPLAIQLNSDAKSNPDFEKIIEPYKSSMESEMNQILIVSESAAQKDLPEGKLGNIACDIILKKANDYAAEQNLKPADICLLNNGGLRAPLPAGEISLGKVYELMPFENEMVILTMSGKKTKQLFQAIANNNGMPLAGARIQIQDSLPPFVTIGGKEFDETKSYRVVTSDYLSNGGDKMYFFKSPESVDTLHHKIRDAIVAYMKEEHKKGNTLKPQLDGRISYKK